MSPVMKSSPGSAPALLLAGLVVLVLAAAFAFLAPIVPCPMCHGPRYWHGNQGVFLHSHPFCEKRKITLFRRAFPARNPAIAGSPRQSFSQRER